MTRGEFDIIEQYFAGLTQGRGEAAGLKDDAAVLKIPDGHELVVTSDTLNAGTHFLPDAAPADIAHKALRVNLSDLAAMGADPHAWQLNIAFPDKPEEAWLEEFVSVLLENQNEFGIFCSGGDTTSTQGPLSLSITAMGLVPEGQAVKRGGAQEGDAIILTGPVGDALIGLRVLQDKIQTRDEEYFIRRYYRPHPRTDLSETIREHAHAAIDISDGLVADLGHICRASGVAAQVDMSENLFSPQARNVIGKNTLTPQELLAGGDDYELLVAVPPDKVDDFFAVSSGCVRIGSFMAGEPQVHLHDEQGEEVEIKHTGWSHF